MIIQDAMKRNFPTTERREETISFRIFILIAFSTPTSTFISILIKVLPNGTKQVNTMRFCYCCPRSIDVCI